MLTAVFSAKEYELAYLRKYNQNHLKLKFLSESLSIQTAHLAEDCLGCCCFVTDELSEPVFKKLAELGVKFITLRSAGYDHVNLPAANEHNITIMRVPKYSPESVAEFAVALILNLSRNIIRAYTNGIKHNFTLDSLLGFNLHKKTVGIIGTGNIGTVFAKIMYGFGVRLLAYDLIENEDCKKYDLKYVTLDTLLKEADIISLHCPLNEGTFHLINEEAIRKMKDGSMLINTGRGALIETQSLITSLKKGKIGFAGLDVYEKESGLFFHDCAHQIITDELFLALQSLPNVLITPHQAFLTDESVTNIAKTTLDNIQAYLLGNPTNVVRD